MVHSSQSPVYASTWTTRRTFVGSLASCVFAPGCALAAARISFSDLLKAEGDFTDIASRNAGHEVEMRGYMAPPLKPEINFFVLAKTPLSICPFCDSAAAWPDDIVLVQMARPIHAVDYDALIRVTGILDIGTVTDPVTGFVSRVRVRDAAYKRV